MAEVWVVSSWLPQCPPSFGILITACPRMAHDQWMLSLLPDSLVLGIRLVSISGTRSTPEGYFQVSASAAVPSMHAGACTTPQQCTGGSVPSQRGCEQPRAAISLHTQLQLCFGAFFHSLLTDKTLPKQLIYQSPLSCCCQCTCQRV